MLYPPNAPTGSVSHVTTTPEWLPPCQTDGTEQIPKLVPPPDLREPPKHMVGFDRIGRDSDPADSMIHFYLQDNRISGLVRSPHRQLFRISRYSSVATPDFSLHRSMPRHKRIGNVWMSRAVGVYFQSRGLTVIPTIRWSTSIDYDFCFAGVPSGIPVTVSNHGCWRSREDKFYFEEGLIALAEVLSPPLILLHGRPLSPSIENSLKHRSVELLTFAPRIALARNGVNDGRG